MDRAFATQKLERMLRDVEAARLPARVKELYVFGSYARGALTVGDLDLIVIHEPPDPAIIERLRAELQAKYGRDIMYWPTWPERRFEAMMRRALCRPGEKVDVLFGTSLDDVLARGENIANATRVCLWSPHRQDWRENLASIREDPTAGRFERRHFASLKRFNGSLSTMERVSEGLADGLLQLTRIPIAQITLDLNAEYQHWLDWWIECRVMGEESMRLLPYGMWWMQNQRGQGSRRPHPPRQSVLYSDDGQYAVFFGRPHLFEVFRLGGSERRLEGLCLIPHLRRDEPNELLVFDRGERFTPARLEALRDRPPD